MRNLARAAALATGALALVVGAAAPAWAPKYILGANGYGDCLLDGTTTRFEGDFRVLGFSASGGTLYVTGTVVGTCFDSGTGDVAYVVPGAAPYTFPVSSLTTDCTRETAVVELRPGAALVGAVTGADAKAGDPVKLTLDLARGTVVDRVWFAGDPRAEGARLCAVDRAYGHVPAAALGRLLNQLVVLR